MKVLLSIKPEFVTKILSGEKRFEFRKNISKNKSVKTIVIYATMTVGKVVGEFDIDYVISDNPDLVWEKTKKYAGISKRFYDAYFEQKQQAFAIAVGRVTQYEEPKPLNYLGNNIVAPQSYRYL
ncbi:ASCH domain-containing protein [Gilliamella sp. B2894]|uniref:ASCH domain-containing protein n=1 Tax=unclassified Gilliamella TaxID=2685620 RepID=UPI00226A1051|nr:MULTISPECIES: ASCH domain-containing protein [unclassified Gilliamella]MCX8656462.1 ASCH domain-containing protein [Gilliamella sp. B2894]MCX8692983.1 ASCH domain-containing protein [Gilliamella sp. B2881]MCX8696232.1 ASCH domain-containing protein [Gilliamella sp. B2828]